MGNDSLSKVDKRRWHV